MTLQSFCPRWFSFSVLSLAALVVFESVRASEDAPPQVEIEAIGPLLNGERHGEWEIRYQGGRIDKGEYRNGVRHGQWKSHLANGYRETGTFRNGLRHGEWEHWLPDGGYAKGTYENDRQHGRWLLRSSDGIRKQGSYRHGKRHGLWTVYPVGDHQGLLDDIGFIVPEALGVSSVDELDGASICVRTGSNELSALEFDIAEQTSLEVSGLRVILNVSTHKNSERHLATYFHDNGMKYEPVFVETDEEARQSYLAERCDAYTTSVPNLLAARSTFTNPDSHLILPNFFPSPPGLIGEAVFEHDAPATKWTVRSSEYGPHGTGDSVDRDGILDGLWEFRWPNGRVEKGRLHKGKREGRWSLLWPDGTVEEGNFRTGKRHGVWTTRWLNRTTENGQYRNGQRDGQWTVRHADGHEERGALRDGVRNGNWWIRWADGTVAVGPYRNGEKHGSWEIRWPDGFIELGTFEHGSRHGRWTIHLGDKNADGNYERGKPVGDWFTRFRTLHTENGSPSSNRHGVLVELEDEYVEVKEGNRERNQYDELTDARKGIWAVHRSDGRYDRGLKSYSKRVGRWMIRYASGSVWTGNYVAGQPTGIWEFRASSGMVEMGRYENGIEHGQWMRYRPNGQVDRGPYIGGRPGKYWNARLPDGTSWLASLSE